MNDLQQTPCPEAQYPAASTNRFQVERLPQTSGEELTYVQITDLHTGEREEFASIDLDDQRRWMDRCVNIEVQRKGAA